MNIKLIVASDPNGVIGVNGSIPWHYPEDFRRFRALTLGQTLLMGDKTFRSLPKELPGRTIVVLTWEASPTYQYWSASLLGGIRVASQISPGRDIWIAGGGQIYEEALRIPRLVTDINLTIVPEVMVPAGAEVVRFPLETLKEFRLLSEGRNSRDPRLTHQIWRRPRSESSSCPH